MLVDVVLMRHLGKRLPLELVRATPAVRGELCLVEQGSGRTDDPRRSATATLSVDGDELLPRLHSVRVTKIEGDSILVGGTEVHVSKVERIASSLSSVQVWWCRRVSSA